MTSIGLRAGALAPLAPLLLAACTGSHAPHAPPAPGPEARTVSTCVVAEGGLAEVRVQVSSAGDTLFQGRPFHAAFPAGAEYAAGAAWYEANQPIPETVAPFENARGDYVKYGPPVAAAADSLVRIGTYRGVALYAEVGDAAPGYAVLYVPHRPGCRFQRYQFVGVGVGRDG